MIRARIFWGGDVVRQGQTGNPGPDGASPYPSIPGRGSSRVAHGSSGFLQGCLGRSLTGSRYL